MQLGHKKHLAGQKSHMKSSTIPMVFKLACRLNVCLLLIAFMLKPLFVQFFNFLNCVIFDLINQF
jgi:hypothetical protein